VNVTRGCCDSLRRALRSLAALLLSARAVPAADVAAEPPAAPRQAPFTRLVWQVDGGVRMNPVGVGVVGGVYHRSVWSHEPELEFDSRYLQLGATLQINPAYVQPGAYVELVPFPFLVLRAEYDVQLLMGMNTGLLRFDSGSEPFGANVLDRRRGDEVWGVAQRGFGQVLLRAAVSRFYASIDNQLYFYAFHDRGPYLYESEFDTLLDRRDWLYNGRGQLALDLSSLDTPPVTFAGAFYERTRAFASELQRQRVGGFFFYEPARGWLGFAASRVFGQLGVNLQDRNREHGVFGAIGAGVDWGG
jgi:hypothetical protein